MTEGEREKDHDVVVGLREKRLSVENYRERDTLTLLLTPNWPDGSWRRRRRRSQFRLSRLNDQGWQCSTDWLTDWAPKLRLKVCKKEKKKGSKINDVESGGHFSIFFPFLRSSHPSLEIEGVKNSRAIIFIATKIRPWERERESECNASLYGGGGVSRDYRSVNVVVSAWNGKAAESDHDVCRTHSPSFTHFTARVLGFSTQLGKNPSKTTWQIWAQVAVAV